MDNATIFDPGESYHSNRNPPLEVSTQDPNYGPREIPSEPYDCHHLASNLDEMHERHVPRYQNNFYHGHDDRDPQLPVRSQGFIGHNGGIIMPNPELWYFEPGSNITPDPSEYLNLFQGNAFNHGEPSARGRPPMQDPQQRQLPVPSQDPNTSIGQDHCFGSPVTDIHRPLQAPNWRGPRGRNITEFANHTITDRSYTRMLAGSAFEHLDSPSAFSGNNSSHPQSSMASYGGDPPDCGVYDLPDMPHSQIQEQPLTFRSSPQSTNAMRMEARRVLNRTSLSENGHVQRPYQQPGTETDEIDNTRMEIPQSQDSCSHMALLGSSPNSTHARPQSGSRRNGKKRIRKLSAEGREHAKKVRNVGACRDCRRRKVKCDHALRKKDIQSHQAQRRLTPKESSVTSSSPQGHQDSELKLSTSRPPASSPVQRSSNGGVGQMSHSSPATKSHSSTTYESVSNDPPIAAGQHGTTAVSTPEDVSETPSPYTHRIDSDLLTQDFQEAYNEV